MEKKLVVCVQVLELSTISNQILSLVLFYSKLEELVEPWKKVITGYDFTLLFFLEFVFFLGGKEVLSLG